MRTLLVIVFLALAVGRVDAQPANVPDLIKLIENQPNDMDRSTWKEKRRDATRKLAQSKDKRGVPVLIRLAESETFDIVGEIAIEGLGGLGDQSAVPTLQAIVADTTRDKTSRDLAKKALAKLGAPDVATAGGTKTGTGTTGTTTTTTTTGTKTGTGTTTGVKTGTGTTTTGTTGTTTGTTGTTTTGSTTTTGTTTTTGGTGTTTGAVTTGGGESGLETSGMEGGGAISGTGSGLLGEKQGTTVENMPELEDDVIGASNRLTFAIGTVGLRVQKLPADDSDQSTDQRIDFDADVSAHYLRRKDTETKAFAINVDAQLVTGWVNPEGRGATRGAVLDLGAGGEARFYSNKLYGIGKAVTSFAMTYVAFTEDMDNGNDVKDTSSQFDLQIALGGGYGRLIDVGGAIRVRRLSRLLDAARALGKPIDAATSKKLQLTWWALRGERSSFRSLIATVAILREAGILLGEPNAVITYEILTVLRDTQLFMRPSGFDAQLVIGEGFLKRPENPGNPDDCLLASCGRIEQVIATVGYGMQMDDDKMEVSADGFARYRLFADEDDGTPTPWAVGGGARLRRYTYGEHGDPFGALDVAGRLRFSNDGFDEMMTGINSDKAMRFEAEAGFTYWMNQASGLRLAAELVMDQKTFFLGARLEGTYGLLDAVYAR